MGEGVKPGAWEERERDAKDSGVHDSCITMEAEWRFWKDQFIFLLGMMGEREKSSFGKSTETLRGWRLPVVGMD